MFRTGLLLPVALVAVACDGGASSDGEAGGAGGSAQSVGGARTSGGSANTDGGAASSNGGDGAGGESGPGTSGGDASGGAGANGGSGRSGDGGSTTSPAGGEGGDGPSGAAGGDAAGGDNSGSGGQGGAGDLPMVPSGCDAPAWNPDDFDTVYEVGPGQEYESPSDVPWESIEAGTLVRIHHRAEPYRDKWILNGAGTEASPIVVLGVPEDGALPVISGEDALTRPEIDFWNEERGIIKVGGGNTPQGPAAFITVECLDIHTGRPGTNFSAADGSSVEYAENAACVYLEEGESITVRNNAIHGCGNGIFASSGTSEVVVAGNYVYDNGNAGSIYEHNSYTESLGITFELNHYGPLCEGCEGNNLKDRSTGTVIRYNWIEAGNRQLDLVESDYDEFVNDPRYAATFVYGNVLVEPEDAGNSQITHYGGDGEEVSRYRKGTLYFFHNTVVSTRSGNTTLFRLSTEEESVTAFNNVFSVEADPSSLALFSGSGAVEMHDNWIPEGWVESHDDVTGSVDFGVNVEGTASCLTDAGAQDFSLLDGSDCVNAGGALPTEAADHAVLLEYVKHQSARVRADDGSPDLGAYERE